MKFSLKNIENWRFWKMTFFWVGHFGFFFSKKNFLFCFFLMKKTLGFIWGIIFFEIFMIILVSSQKSLPPNISAGSVLSKKLYLKKSPCNFVRFAPLISLLFANKSTFIIQINFYIRQERKVFSALKSQ